MSGRILVGQGREIQRIAGDQFVNAVNHLTDGMAARLAFMSREHHTVRDFVVRELPRHRRPLSSRQIATATGIEFHRVSTILSELEKQLFFLVRNSEGDVNWAFPVTTDATAHRLSISTGENIFGA